MEKNASEFNKYLKIFYRRRFLFLAVSLLVMTVAIAWIYSMPRQYQAASTVFIEKSIIDELVKGIAVTPSPDSHLQVLRYDMLSRDVLSKVLREMEADTPLANDTGFQDLVDALQKRTEITIKGKEGLFIVSFNDPDPKFAQDYVNTLVRTYVDQNISGKREETFGAGRFLDEQLAHFKSRLDQAEDAIIAFRKSQGVFLANGEQPILADLQKYAGEVESISLTLDTLQAKHARLKSQLRSVEPKVAIFSEGQKGDRIIRLEQQINQLLLTYTENYPEVIRLKAEIEMLKRQEGSGSESTASEGTMFTPNPMHQDLQQSMFDVEAEISSLAARKARLLQLAEARKLELQDVPENKKALAVLEQERDSHRRVFEQLLLRKGQTEVSKQMEIGNKSATFRIIDAAVLPSRPVSPDMVRMILMAIAAGLGAGAGLVLLLENMNASVFEVQQLRDLGLEVCAIIPSMVDPALVARDRRRNLLAYGASGLYFSGILGLLAFEVLKGMA
jgi:polysaccharide chain length determinant protein (PEP-CTERM system associated)